MNEAKQSVPELKPCPFCGSEATVFCGFLLAHHRVVECSKCRSRATLYGSGTTEENESRAIASWNTRATQSPEPHAELAAALTSEDHDLIIGAIPLQALPEPPSVDAEAMAKRITEPLEGSLPEHIIAGVFHAIVSALTTAQAKQKEVDAGIAEDPASIRMVGGSTGDAHGTSRLIAAAIRAGGKQ